MKTIVGILALALLGAGWTEATAEELPPLFGTDKPSQGDTDWKTVKLKYRDKLDFEFEPWAYVRFEYENIEGDDRYDFVGRNDGFILDDARVGFEARLNRQLTMALSIEAASDKQKDTNDPLGEIEVQVRDAFGRWDPIRFIGIQGGQFKAPFAAEELRSSADLLFIDRAVGQEGVLPGRGFEQPGLEVDRQIGAMISPQDAITLADFGVTGPNVNQVGLRYYVMAANGNGESQLINDNSDLAVFARLELIYADLVTMGGGYLHNDRKVGSPPNRFNEHDDGWAADLLITPYDGEIFFQWVEVDTDFPTVGSHDRKQIAWHVQAGYRFDTPWFFITPAYRYATFDPWAQGNDGSGLDLDSFDVDYHTFGLKGGPLILPLTLYFNYTITDEANPRELNNDRIQVLAQVEF